MALNLKPMRTKDNTSSLAKTSQWMHTSAGSYF